LTVFIFSKQGGEKMIICECGEIVCGNDLFKDYIKTSVNPSTPTIGHKKCGCIFNFIEYAKPKKFSSKKEIKSIAMRFAEHNKLDQRSFEKFFIEVDRLKSGGKLSDYQILINAYRKVINE
jgi:hypothetical protein